MSGDGVDARSAGCRSTRDRSGRRAISSSRSAAIDSTVTSSSAPRSRRAPPARWWTTSPAAGRAAGRAPLLRRRPTTRREALQDVARHVRRASGARVVAITGSAGKTTTKEISAELLSARYTVFRNKGNLNNHIGLPLSLLELRTRPDVAVVELGMNHPGEISTLVGIAEPEVRVWTNVGDAHIGFFASADAIADAKAEILEGAPGDRRSGRQRRRCPGHARGRGRSPAARSPSAIAARRRRPRRRTSSCAASTASAPTSTRRRAASTWRRRCSDRGNLANVLAATAVAVHARRAAGGDRGARRRAAAAPRTAASCCGCPAASRSSTIPTTRARRRSSGALETVAAADRQRAQDRGARRDARARRPRGALHRDVRRRGRRARLDVCVVAGGSGRAGARRRRRSAAGLSAAQSSATCRTTRRRSTRSCGACRPAISCWSRDRAASASTSSSIG